MLVAKEKNVERITDMEVDFAQWFTDVVTKAELIDYSGVKGMYILRPYGYAIWENIQAILDRRKQKRGIGSGNFPQLIGSQSQKLCLGIADQRSGLAAAVGG